MVPEGEPKFHHKIRILRLITRMNVGGPAIQVTGISQLIDKNLFEHRLISGYCEEDEIDYLDFHEIDLPIQRIAGLRRSINLISDVKSFFNIRSAMKDFRPDIVHTHTTKAGVLGRLASISLNVRMARVHTFHGHVITGYFSPTKSKIIIFTERVLAKFSDILIGVGETVVKQLLVAKIGSPSQFRVVNPGINLEINKSREDVRSELNIDCETFLVIWVGRFAPIKAPHRVIEIAEQCLQRKLNVTFLMVGNGVLFESIKMSSAKKSLPINFTGWRSDAGNLISGSDLLLLTSENEGTPISIIEAQIAGIPVLSTDVGSVNELVFDNLNGYVRDYETKSFVDLINKLMIDKSLWNKFSLNAKKISKDRFTIKRLIQDLEQIYKDLMQSNRSSS